jgi:hypothetical protein
VKDSGVGIIRSIKIKDKKIKIKDKKKSKLRTKRHGVTKAMLAGSSAVEDLTSVDR